MPPGTAYSAAKRPLRKVLKHDVALPGRFGRTVKVNILECGHTVAAGRKRRPRQMCWHCLPRQ